MKYFVAFALLVAVASAAFIKPSPISAEAAEVQEIIAAIQSPSTNPATAAALQQMLMDILGIKPEPVAVGPAIVEQTPIAGPAIIDFPLPDGGDFIDVSPVVIVPGPAADAAAASAPLVQIILNINQAESSPVDISPVIVPQPVDVAQPIEIIDNFPVVAPVIPVDVVDVMPSPVQPVEVIDVMPVPVQPVDVVETAPIAVEPVVIGTPQLPSPAIVLPEELN